MYWEGRRYTHLLGEGKKKETVISQNVLGHERHPHALGNDVLTPKWEWACTRPSMQLPSTHPLLTLAWRSFFQGFGSKQFPQQLLRTICPGGHALAEAPGPPGSVYQRSQYFRHDRLPSQCPNYSSLKAAGINPQDVHRPTFCLKERAQNAFPSGWYK